MSARWRMVHQLKKKNDHPLTGLIREQYLVEWVFLAILWVVSVVCAYILSVNILLLPQLGPPYWPSPDVTLWAWLILVFQHPFVWPAALATIIALALTLGFTIYFTIALPSRIDSTIRLELSRIGKTTKKSFRRLYVTQIDSKGVLKTQLLPKITSSGEYGLVVLRATLPDISTEELKALAQRYFLAWDKLSLATVCSLDELHFKVTQLARAFAEL